MRDAFVLAGVAIAFSAAAETSTLRFNPFAVPDLASLEAGSAAASPASTDSAPWKPVLRATLLASEDSLVDLGGVLLSVGESHRGWRLLEVGEFEATFERQRERVTLPVARVEDGER